MSTRLKPAKCTIRQANLKWMNQLVHLHDNFCDCPTPVEHTSILLFQQEPDQKFTPIEKDIIKKCLGGEHGDPATTKDDGDVLGEGDLDTLFAEDFGDHDDTG